MININPKKTHSNPKRNLKHLRESKKINWESNHHRIHTSKKDISPVGFLKKMMVNPSVEEVPGLGCSHKPRVSDHSVDLWIVDHIYCCLSKGFKLNICWLCFLKIIMIQLWCDDFVLLSMNFGIRTFEISTCPFLQGCCSQESAPQHSALIAVEIGVKNQGVEVPDVEVAFTIGILQLFCFPLKFLEAFKYFTISQRF